MTIFVIRGEQDIESSNREINLVCFVDCYTNFDL